MKNKVFLTEEGKQEIEAEYKRFSKSDQWQDQVRASFLEKILQSATILPVEESWEYVNELYDGVRKQLYPQGIIIQPKS
jgi:hypothetical protein